MSTTFNWPNSPPKWTEDTLSLLLENYTPSSPPESLKNLIAQSKSFPVNFPITSVQCESLSASVSQNKLEENINSAYPIIHENVLLLYTKFILHKRKFGTAIEKEYYKHITLLKLIDRLLTKRAVIFMGRFDSYLLLDGTKGAGKWDQIGKTSSKLSLENCVSYDEIKLSVFLSVSSYTHFINNGTRKNLGKIATDRSRIEQDGVIIGIIGARFKKVGFMEYQEIVIDKSQNTTENGYEKFNEKSVVGIFLNFYDESGYTYEGNKNFITANPARFIKLENDKYFDNLVYSKRIALSIDTLLIEANERSRHKGTTAFIHVVGIGLGVWKCSSHQEEVFVDVFVARLKSLGKHLSAISDVYFSYFPKIKNIAGYKNGDVLKIDDQRGIKLHVGKRDPHDKLTGENRGKLLVVSYAWDGNALPGNEFWKGQLGSTGDSAAASSTQISEIHNPHINSRVSVDNLRIATVDGVVTFNDYISAISKKRNQD